MEDNAPPIKYLTMVNILEKDESSSEVQAAKSKIMTYRPVVEIMNHQKENSYWFDKRKDQNYKKYLGTFWQLLFLSEMYAEKNEQIGNAIEHIFTTGQAPNGGFSISGTNSYAIVCLTANMLRALVHFGYWKDDRTQKALEYLLSSFVDTKGNIRCQAISLVSNCYMALPKILFALSNIPEKGRTSRVMDGINLCVKRLLANQIYKYVPEKNSEWLKIVRERKLKGQLLYDERKRFLEKYPSITMLAKPSWMKFGFPHSYTSDALDAMRALLFTNVAYSPKMDSALDLITSKSKDGKWILEKQYKSPMYAQIEPHQKESKWLTLHALLVLKFYKGLKIS